MSNNNFYPASDNPTTQNLGLALWDMSITMAENFEILDSAVGGGSTSIKVNGATVTNPNFVNSANVSLSVAGSNISLTAAPLTFSTAGQGFFWGGSGSDLPAAAATTTAVISSNNQIMVFQFIIAFAITVRNVTVRINSANSGKFCGCGIYDINGNLLIDSGRFDQTTLNTTLANSLPSPVVLPPGTYYFAYSQDSTNASTAGYTTLATQFIILNGTSAVRRAFATNSWSSSTGFPPTLGALTQSAAGSFPLVLFSS